MTHSSRWRGLSCLPRRGGAASSGCPVQGISTLPLVTDLGQKAKLGSRKCGGYRARTPIHLAHHERKVEHRGKVGARECRKSNPFCSRVEWVRILSPTACCFRVQRVVPSKECHMGERKRLLLFSTISLMFLLSCQSQHSADENYILVASNLQVPYWQAAGAGFLQQAQQMKVRAEFVGPKDYDPKAQQDEFRKAVQKKPTGILVSPADPSLMKDDIDAAIAAGIPVLTIDSDAPSSKRLFFIGTNNYQAGLMGGQRLVKELQGKGNVVVFTMPEQSNLKERLRGYRDALEAYPQIKITQVVDIKGDPLVAFDTTTALLGKQGVNAFVCLEAQAGKEVATVLKSRGIKDKVVLAMD